MTAKHLREDIEVLPGGHDITGNPGLVLHDPLRHRFFWLSEKARASLDLFRGRGGDAVHPEDVKALEAFLHQNRLLQSRPGDAKALHEIWARGQRGVFSQVLHNYVSFRIPLLRPEAFLDATLDVARLLASRTVFWFVAFVGALGILLTAQQWDQFVAMFLSSFTLAGAFAYAVTLMLLKVFHELGHAYVARHFGCRVPSMGVTFMLLAPMLYTDATDAWRLSSRRARFLIGAAGVAVELAIASFALLLWALLPDGPGRAIAFFVAATAWIASVAVNLSPFMRFDGYHMLVDALGMHSVGPRSFALASWWLREQLLLPQDAPPEFLKPQLRRLLVGFAFATWIYRFTLFTGIAWLLYVSLPKAVGLPLALVELHFFIVLPVWREVKTWKLPRLHGRPGNRRGVTSLVVLVLLVGLGLAPLDRHVEVPAVLLPGREARVFASEAAQVIRIMARAGERVAEGDALVQLFVPEIGYRQRQAKVRLALAEQGLARIAADATERAALLVLEQQRQAAETELQGLARRGGLLLLRSPLRGQVTGDSMALREGQWVSGQDALFLIADGTTARLVGLMQEREAGRVQSRARLTFVPADGVGARRVGAVQDIGLPGAEGMALPYLSSQFGGVVAVEQGRDGPNLLLGQLPMLAQVDGAADGVAISGTAMVEAESQSVLGFLFARLATVLLRESGF